MLFRCKGGPYFSPGGNFGGHGFILIIMIITSSEGLKATALITALRNAVCACFDNVR